MRIGYIFYGIMDTTAVVMIEPTKLASPCLLVSDVVSQDVAVPVFGERGFPVDGQGVLVHRGNPDVHRGSGGGLLLGLDGHGVRGSRLADLVLSQDPEVVGSGRPQTEHASLHLLTGHQNMVNVIPP